MKNRPNTNFKIFVFYYLFTVLESQEWKIEIAEPKKKEMGHSSGAVCGGKGSKVELLLLHNEGNRWRPVQGTFLRNTILSVSFERSTETLTAGCCRIQL